MKFETRKIICADDIEEAKRAIGKQFFFARTAMELEEAVEGLANYKPHKLIRIEVGKLEPYVCYWEQEKQMMNYAFIYPYEEEIEIQKEEC